MVKQMLPACFCISRSSVNKDVRRAVSALMGELEEVQPGHEQESGICRAAMLSVSGTSSQLRNDYADRLRVRWK